MPIIPDLPIPVLFVQIILWKAYLRCRNPGLQNLNVLNYIKLVPMIWVLIENFLNLDPLASRFYLPCLSLKIHPASHQLTTLHFLFCNHIIHRNSPSSLHTPSPPSSSRTTKNTTMRRQASLENINGVKAPKFCHECGTKYPVPSAKFCCECGTRRPLSR